MEKLICYLKQKEIECYELANHEKFDESAREYYGGACDAIKEVLEFIKGDINNENSNEIELEGNGIKYLYNTDTHSAKVIYEYEDIKRILGDNFLDNKGKA